MDFGRLQLLKVSVGQPAFCDLSVLKEPLHHHLVSRPILQERVPAKVAFYIVRELDRKYCM